MAESGWVPSELGNLNLIKSWVFREICFSYSYRGFARGVIVLGHESKSHRDINLKVPTGPFVKKDSKIRRRRLVGREILDPFRFRGALFFLFFRGGYVQIVCTFDSIR